MTYFRTPGPLKTKIKIKRGPGDEARSCSFSSMWHPGSDPGGGGGEGEAPPPPLQVNEMHFDQNTSFI